MIKRIVFVLISVLYLIECGKVCFDDYGCFTDEAPFGFTEQRPLANLPQPPEIVNTTFYLFTRQKSRRATVITPQKLGKFKLDRPTKIIVHGWLQKADKPWFHNIKDSLLSVEDVNVVWVDWSKGAMMFYSQSVANTQIVGAAIANLINSLVDKGVDPKNFHCIGHSLGAHVCGYAGKRVTGLGRISGLDPAGPFFEDTDPIVRLDKTDADYVDILHTDGQSLGISQQIGHVDYNPNGGLHQPGCESVELLQVAELILNTDPSKIELVDIDTFLGCSHASAYLFYVQTIIKGDCEYKAYNCSSENDFEDGKCFYCPEEGCNQMGYYSSPDKQNGSLYLVTQPAYNSQSCGDVFYLRIRSSNHGFWARGNFTLTAETNTGQSLITMLDQEKTTFLFNKEHRKLVSLPSLNLNTQINKITISYSRIDNYWISWLFSKKWTFDNLVMIDTEYQKSHFCPDPSFVSENNRTSVLIRCD